MYSTRITVEINVPSGCVKLLGWSGRRKPWRTEILERCSHGSDVCGGGSAFLPP